MLYHTSSAVLYEQTIGMRRVHVLVESNWDTLLRRYGEAQWDCSKTLRSCVPPWNQYVSYAVHRRLITPLYCWVRHCVGLVLAWRQHRASAAEKYVYVEPLRPTAAVRLFVAVHKFTSLFTVSSFLSCLLLDECVGPPVPLPKGEMFVNGEAFATSTAAVLV